MVASANGDLYNPFPKSMTIDEGPQSSEDGSGLHSPIFGPPFPPHGDSSLRYPPDHLDAHNTTTIINSQFVYSVATPSLNIPHNSSLLETLEVPSPGSQHANPYTAELPHPPHPHRIHNQLAEHFPLHSPSNTRLPPPPTQGSTPLNFAFSSSSPERRLPGAQPHDQLVSSSGGTMTSGMPMDSNHRQPSPSTARRDSSAPTPAREARKEISMVVIACRQCRARKIRCDSTRPVCNNCVRRSNECQYDAVPKRRGPDKRPGTRQRSCKKRPADGSVPPPPPSKRKRTSAATTRTEDNREPVKIGIKENMTGTKRTLSSSSSSSRPINLSESQAHSTHVSQPPASPVADLGSGRAIMNEGMYMKHPTQAVSRRDSSSMYDSDSFSKSFARQLDVNVHRSIQSDHSDKLYSAPSPEYLRKTWWDGLLEWYSSSPEQSMKSITDDLNFLFTSTSYWLSFVNVPVFLRTLYSPEGRERMQPSLIYAGLAMATLMRSSELEMGHTGRVRALWLRDAAQQELEQAWSSRRLDHTLAEAALILALFESSAHPSYSPERYSDALIFLDNIIRSLNLTFVDMGDPNVTVYAPRAVPVVSEPEGHGTGPGSSESIRPPKKCSCIPVSNIPPDHYSSSWKYTPPWDPSWSPEELRKEECRRLCWSALNLIASYTSQCAVFNREAPVLFLTDPANYSLLFPGEALDRAPGNHRSSPKESVWALYCRSMLLWNFCIRLRTDNCSNEDKAEYALETWVETQAIQDALDNHVCNLDTALMYMCREYLYNTRMTVTQALRRLVPPSDIGSNPIAPVFNRKQAEEWLYYQDQVIRRVRMSVHHLGEPQGHLLTRRPFQVTWFLSQLAICLSLWERDHSLMNSLELAKSIMVPIDILNSVWPCSLQQNHADELRKALNEACVAAGLTLLPAKEYSLPHLRTA